MKTTNFPNYLLVKKSNKYGLTVFATKKIPKGHVIVTTDFTNMDYTDGCIGTPYGDLFHHSRNEANVFFKLNDKINLKIDLYALKDIEKGDEILMNYEQDRPTTKHTNSIRLNNGKLLF